MIHDWLFVARHCLTDGTPTAEERRIDDMEFIESAEIIAEAIKALIASGKVRENDVAPRVIAGAVAGPISYQRWTVQGECKTDRVSETDRAAAEAGIPGSAKSLRGMVRRTPDGRAVPVTPAEFVAAVTF